MKRLFITATITLSCLASQAQEAKDSLECVERIRTKRQAGEGLGLDLSLTDDQDLRYGMNQPNCKLSMNYRQGAVDVFGSVWYSHLVCPSPQRHGRGQSLNRAMAFDLWMKSPMPMVTLTKTFNVTGQYKISKGFQFFVFALFR